VTWPGLKTVLRGMMPEPRPMEADKPTYEQMKEVIDLAEMFDALQHLPVWQKVLERMAATMNHELVEAANKKYDREARMMHVDMYHAKREVLDDLQGWMEATQNERTRIMSEFKERPHEH